jgi:hypothetical protein
MRQRAKFKSAKLRQRVKFKNAKSAKLRQRADKKYH